MLFQLAEYEYAATLVFGQAVDELAMVHHPILREVQKRTVRDVRPTRITEGDEPPLTMETIEIGAEISLDGQEIANGDLGSVYLAADTLGDAKGGGIVKAMVEQLGQITELTGNQVEAGGRPFSYQLYFEMLESMEIDFDEAGKPTFSILTSPAMAESIKALPPPTPEQDAQYNAIMTRKRAEFEARKKTRRLT